MRRASFFTLVLIACSSPSAVPTVVPDKDCGEPKVELDVSSESEAAKLSGCTRYLGSIRFGDSVFANVDARSPVRVVDGNINLFRNGKLGGLGGLRSLERVGGNLLVHNNGALSDLSGLSKLRTVGGELYVASELALVSLRGLEGLERVDGDLVILSNPALPQLDATAIASRIQVGGKTRVENNKP